MTTALLPAARACVHVRVCVVCALAASEELAALLHDTEGRGLDKRQIGEYLGGRGWPHEAVREAYVAHYDFCGMTFVAALRVFLAGFQLPGESMLIERIIATFACRFYEHNPAYCDHLSDARILRERGVSVDLVEVFLGFSAGHDTIGLQLLAPLVRSLGRDFKRLKDDELSAMMLVTADELLHVRQLLELEPLGSNELAAIPPIMRRATEVVLSESEAELARSQAQAARVAAEQTARAAAEASADEQLQLGQDAKERALEAEALKSVALAKEDTAAEKQRCFDEFAPGFTIGLPLFQTMVARKLGSDSMFVLAYSVIMLNTDAHNPRLKGERINKADFISNNRRSPDLAVLSEVIMASIYDEILGSEIKMKTGAPETTDDDTHDGEEEAVNSPRAAALPSRGNPHRKQSISFEDVGQTVFEVQFFVLSCVLAHISAPGLASCTHGESITGRMCDAGAAERAAPSQWQERGQESADRPHWHGHHRVRCADPLQAPCLPSGVQIVLG